MKRTKSVDDYILKETIWQDELKALRQVLLPCGLTECIKWGAPCYTYNGKNILGMMAFKPYFGLWFHQGVFLKDPDGVLVNAQEGKTKALRQWRMTDMSEIDAAKITRYVQAAIQLEKDGKRLKPKPKPLVMPPELQNALANDASAKAAFEVLTLGKQREFADYISEAKQDATKARRLAKILPMIISGIGLSDKYRSG